MRTGSAGNQPHRSSLGDLKRGSGESAAEEASGRRICHRADPELLPAVHFVFRIKTHLCLGFIW